MAQRQPEYSGPSILEILLLVLIIAGAVAVGLYAFGIVPPDSGFRKRRLRFVPAGSTGLAYAGSHSILPAHLKLSFVHCTGVYRNGSNRWTNRSSIRIANNSAYSNFGSCRLPSAISWNKDRDG